VFSSYPLIIGKRAVSEVRLCGRHLSIDTQERAVDFMAELADQAILTMVGSEVEFELVFVQQLIARGTGIALTMSTNGGSPRSDHRIRGGVSPP
jgi:hypothetical protein